MQSVNPATGEVIKEYAEHSPAEVEHRLRLGAVAFESWRATPVGIRTARLQQAAVLLRERKRAYARLMTEEMGKPVVAAIAEIEKCARVCDFYAEHGPRFLAEEQIATDAAKSYVRFDPLGAVLAIMPWNFPFWQVFRFAAPALCAGNVGLLKHAANVCGTALAIEEVFRDAGFPEGAFSTLLLSSSKVADIIRHPVIRAVTLTGSEKAGADVAAVAGEQLKKTVLELGGSDPFIVLADADIERAAREATRARTINAGQSCIAAKRFLIEEAIADKFEYAFVKAMQGCRIGDPLDESTEIGPLAREDLLDQLQAQVDVSVKAGAVLLAGGKRLDRTGFFYAPTVLGNVKPGMAAFSEETFGPVAAVVRAKNADEAIGLANLSTYGLGASIWTGDTARAEQLAPRVEVGCVFINSIVQSDPRLPFGGVKRSGYGRELGEFGIREFVNIKTVSVG